MPTALSDGYILMAVGMAVVFSALSLLVGAIVLLKRILERPPAVEEKPEAKEAEAEEKPEEPVLDDQLIAILTAAATAALGARARVYRVRFLEEEYISDHAWVQAGRSELHMSHRPRS